MPDMETEEWDAGPYFLCPVQAIKPNPLQPRKNFDRKDLAGLAESIRKNGIIQPLIVRKLDGEGEGFELIAGERRWRAAQLVAGLREVPVVIKDIAAAEVLEVALIENIQRRDLNPLEEADAYDRLIREFHLTRTAVAARLGKKRSTVSNTMRLLQLPDFAKRDLVGGVITEGHARVLLSLGKNEAAMLALREVIVDKDLSVRQAEKLARQRREKGGKKGGGKVAERLPAKYCRELLDGLTSYLGCKTRIRQKGAQGKLEIEYRSREELERLHSLIIKER